MIFFSMPILGIFFHYLLNRFHCFHSNVETFLLGSTEKIKIDVIVQNEGEDSFETTYHMTIPQGINYVKVERMSDNDNDIPVQCSAPSVSTNHTLLCDIGNPLPRSRYVSN